MEVRDTDELRGQSEISLGKYGYKEKDVQRAILESLGESISENILFVDDEVEVGPSRERIDILGLDDCLNACIIEIKMNKLGRDDVKQVIKYAPYVSNFDKDEFETEFHGNSEEFQKKMESLSEGNGQINERQRLLLIAPEVEARTMLIMDWLQSQGVNIELILFSAFDHPTEDTAVLTTQRETIDPDEFRKENVRMWKKSKQKAKEYHLNAQASPETKPKIKKLVQKIKSQTELRGPDWRQKNYIAFGDGDIRVKVRPQKRKVRVYFIYKTGSEFDKNIINEQVRDAQAITINDDKERIEFDLAPDAEELTLDSLVQFVNDEL